MVRWLRCLSAAVLIAYCGVMRAQSGGGPAFEVASVKAATCGNTTISQPGVVQFQLTNVTMNFLIAYAYNARQYQMEGAPGWIGTQCYTVSAKAEGDTPLNYEELRVRLQRLLAKRFKLAVHRETKEVAGYALVVAKGGSKLVKSAESAPGPGAIMGNGLRAKGWGLSSFTAMLANPVRQPVVDKTGLTGTYDIQLSYAPEGATDSELPSIFTAVQEQMGLKLEPQKVPVEMVVIDHVEKVPTEN